MLKEQKLINNLSELCLLALIVAIWAFNEEKYIVYPIKIVFIVMYLLKWSFSGGRVNFYQAWCLIMAGLSLIFALYASHLNASLYTLVNMIQVLLIGFALSGSLIDKGETHKAFNYIIIGGMTLAVRLLIVTPPSVWLSYMRLGDAIHYNSNDVGNKAAIAAIVSLCLFKNSQKKSRKIYLACFIALSIITVFSGSRKSLIAIVLTIVMLYTIGLENKKNIVFGSIGIAVAFGISYHLIMNNEVLYATMGRRLESMIDVIFHGGSERSSIDLRYKYMNAAIELIKQSPFFGIGLGNFAIVSGIGRYCHNDYLEVACSYGILGAIVYYSNYFVLLYKLIGYKGKQELDNSCIIILAVLLVNFLTMVMYTSAYVQIILALLWAHYNLEMKKRNWMKGDTALTSNNNLTQ